MRVTFGKIGFVGSLLIILGLTFFPQQTFVSHAQAADKVSMRLHWKASGMHVPFIVAMDQGYFKAEGIDITVKEGAGSTATVKLMGANKDTFGMAGTNVIVKGVARGMPIIQVAVVEASKRQGVLSKPEAGIQTPKDLIGKTIAGSGAGTSDIFNAFLSANNIPVDKVKYLAAGRARLEAVAAGRADGSLGLGLDDIVRLKGMGIASPQLLEFGKWGVPDHGDGIITNLDTVKNNPDLIRRFIRAYIRGVNYTFMDFERAADITKKHFPMAKKEHLVVQLTNLKWLFPPPLGYQEPGVIEAVRDMTAKYGGIPEAKDMPLSKFYTNEFLPKN